MRLPCLLPPPFPQTQYDEHCGYSQRDKYPAVQQCDTDCGKGLYSAFDCIPYRHKKRTGFRCGFYLLVHTDMQRTEINGIFQIPQSAFYRFYIRPYILQFILNIEDIFYCFCLVE